MANNLKKFALIPTTIHHLRDGNDELMYVDGDDGKPDLTKPMRAHMYGPGTKIYADARQASNNRQMDRFKKKGKSDQTAKESREETATFLSACTAQLENIEIDQLAGSALHMAAYTDLELCFIPQQLDKLLGDTANFTKESQAS